MSEAVPFSSEQLHRLDVAAHVCSSFSLFGSLITIISFIAYPPLRKPVNRLAVCLAIANGFSCLAYSWGRHPIKAGRTSAFCQTQGFLITWFVMTDPLIILTMAANVCLRVLYRRAPVDLRRLDFIGLSIAFSAPLATSLTFLLWRPQGRTVYGDAVLWCWISHESELLRLVAFYLPIWIFILLSLALFVLGGRKINQVRRELKAAARENHLHQMHAQSDSQQSRYCTERVSTKLADVSDHLKSPVVSSVKETTGRSLAGDVEVEHWDKDTPQLNGLCVQSAHAYHVERRCDHETAVIQRPRSVIPSSNIQWKYVKFAFLCSLGLFITWLPISINRVYNTFVSPNHQIYGLYLASAICIPLHGFGNFLVYVTIHWTEFRQFMVSMSAQRGVE